MHDENTLCGVLGVESVDDDAPIVTDIDTQFSDYMVMSI